MATNRILSNAKEFIKKLDEVQIEIHKSVLIGISEWMDDVRNNAVDKYMIPNRFASNTILINVKGTARPYVRINGKLYRLSTLQKSVPGRVTIRTGMLASIIKQPGTWKINRKATEIKFNGTGKFGRNALLWVRPQLDGYLARFTFGKGTEGSNDPITVRLNNESGGKFGAHRRPFLKPAIASTESKFEPSVWRRLSKSVNKTL
ncbi:MAG: hypothetical protein LLG05_00485 [Porphyromonadaceae bacterium]|nr:hypothetical protein [Porphyromonadaceae bacterium]